MKKLIIAIFFTSLCISCSKRETKPSLLVFEIRIASDFKPDKTSIHIFDGGSACGMALSRCDIKADGKYTVYSDSALLFPGKKERYLFLDQNNENKPIQYFILDVPSDLKKKEWSDWCKPAFVADWGANSYAPLFDSGKGLRKKDIPKNTFEMRFKLEPKKEYKVSNKADLGNSASASSPNL